MQVEEMGIQESKYSSYTILPWNNDYGEMSVSLGVYHKAQSEEELQQSPYKRSPKTCGIATPISGNCMEEIKSEG